MSDSKIISANVIDLIDLSEKTKIDDYISYLKCYKCSEVLLDPKFCTTCGLTSCNKCKQCSHPITQSRHVKSLLNGLSFKCKFNIQGCKEIIKYTELRTHLTNCNFALLQNGSVNNSSQAKNININDSLKYSAFSPNDYIFLSSDKIFNTKANDCEKVGVNCLKCQVAFYERKEYIEHSKLCFAEEAENLQKMNKETIIKNFYILNDQVRSKFKEFILCKTEENRKLAIQQFINFENGIKTKKDGVINIENQIKQMTKDESMKDDPEFQSLIDQELLLNQKKKEIFQEIINKKEAIQNLIKEKEAFMKDELKIRRDELMKLELEEKWAREDLQSSIFINLIGEKCSTCGEEEASTKKYFCQTCRNKYCVGKCSYQCKLCPKFICPKDTKNCKLCNKTLYCDTCQKKCFFQGCTNTFCPECYKKNEHQARNSNTNCKLFTCERDGVCECLMTSMFCNKCEKRLCNKCLLNDKAHFPFLK